MTKNKIGEKEKEKKKKKKKNSGGHRIDDGPHRWW
jgi:hypothetical protein